MGIGNHPGERSRPSRQTSKRSRSAAWSARWLDVEYGGRGKDPWGNERVGSVAKTSLVARPRLDTFEGPCARFAKGPDGKLYAGGDFASSGEAALSSIAV